MPLRRTYSVKLGARSGVTRECAAEGCTETFYAYPSTGQRFCSKPCMYRSKPPRTEEQKEATRQAMLARNRKGKRNPNYRNGSRVGAQDRAMNRTFSLTLKGEGCCRNCGAQDNMGLHHVIPRRVGTKESRTDIRNGLPLCGSCHMSWHAGVQLISRSIFTEEEWAYISMVQLTGREITGWLDKNYPVEEDPSMLVGRR